MASKEAVRAPVRTRDRTTGRAPVWEIIRIQVEENQAMMDTARMLPDLLRHSYNLLDVPDFLYIVPELATKNLEETHIETRR